VTRHGADIFPSSVERANPSSVSDGVGRRTPCPALPTRRSRSGFARITGRTCRPGSSGWRAARRRSSSSPAFGGAGSFTSPLPSLPSSGPSAVGAAGSARRCPGGHVDLRGRRPRASPDPLPMYGYGHASSTSATASGSTRSTPRQRFTWYGVLFFFSRTWCLHVGQPAGPGCRLARGAPRVAGRQGHRGGGRRHGAAPVVGPRRPSGPHERGHRGGPREARIKAHTEDPFTFEIDPNQRHYRRSAPTVAPTPRQCRPADRRRARRRRAANHRADAATRPHRRRQPPAAARQPARYSAPARTGPRRVPVPQVVERADDPSSQLRVHRERARAGLPEPDLTPGYPSPGSRGLAPARRTPAARAATAADRVDERQAPARYPCTPIAGAG
jgi:hypothetical protein